MTNYVNWHRENLRSDRENTGNLKYNLSGYPVLTLPLTSDYQEVPRTVPGSREAGEGRGGGLPNRPLVTMTTDALYKSLVTMTTIMYHMVDCNTEHGTQGTCYKP